MFEDVNVYNFYAFTVSPFPVLWELSARGFIRDYIMTSSDFSGIHK